MNRLNMFLAFALLVLFVGLCSCSRQNDTTKADRNAAPTTQTQKAKEAVQEYGRKPIDKARAAQSIGLSDERAEAIDGAVQTRQ